MEFVCELANRLRLAVNEFGAELERDLEVGEMPREDPTAEAGAGLEHDDAATLAAEFSRGGETGSAGAYYRNVEGQRANSTSTEPKHMPGWRGET